MGRHADEGGLPAEVHHQLVGGAALARVGARHSVTTVTRLGGLQKDVLYLFYFILFYVFYYFMLFYIYIYINILYIYIFFNIVILYILFYFIDFI